MQVVSMYSTSNQQFTRDALGTDENAYGILAKLGARLRKAMGENEILSRSTFIGGEFRVPTYRAYAESLDANPWMVYAPNGQSLRVVDYNNKFDGWNSDPWRIRHGFMATAVSPYEYAYELWDKWTHKFHPDLLDNGTFGVWLELLPQPVSVVIEGQVATIRWAGSEPRVHRFREMARYNLPTDQREVSAISTSWRLARAEAYVRAWERMADYEPPDRYKAVMLAEQQELEARWK